MAGATVQIKDREVRELLTGMLSVLGNLEPVMKQVGEIVATSIQENFEDHRGPDGTRWMPVDDDYAAWKRKKGHSPDDILVFSGALMDSIAPKADATSVEIGTGPHIVYAAIHQFGGRIVRGKRAGGMPARPYMGVKETDWPEIRRALLKYLLRKR